MPARPVDPLLPSDVLARYRAEFPITAGQTFLDHAGVSPTSMRVVHAVHEWMTRLAHRARPSFEAWEEEAEACRRRFSRLVGAGPEEVAFVKNTSHGLSLIAAGLDWKPGDRVAVGTAVEYPSNVYPWMDLARRGVVTLDAIEPVDGTVDADAVDAALRPATRLVAVSSAQFGSGSLTDLAAIGEVCRDHGALLCVDGIQTVGVAPVDVKAMGVHFLSADSHKWMLGMMGVGAMFIDRNLIDHVRPVLLGWRSVTGLRDFDSLNLDLPHDARRYEEGSLQYPLIAGFEKALELIEEVGVDTIAGHVRALVDRLATGLEEWGCCVAPEAVVRGHILSFRHPGVATAELAAALAHQRIVTATRRGSIRVSPHFYNSVEEIEGVIEAVGRVVGT